MHVVRRIKAGGVHSVYKPVPPPKPYGSSASASHAGPGASLSAEEQQQQQAGASRDQVAPVIGSTLQAGPPPLLPHILVTDQGHFHTHSTKFPIESREGPASLFSRGPPRLSTGRSATLGRGVGGVSDLTAAMGVPAKGSTLPRSTRMPSLLDLRPSAQSVAAPHTHAHHAHAHPHSHGTASAEERDQLLAGDQRQPRFLDGIDNPALVDDATHMPSYRATPGGAHAAHTGIPPEGTLAGVLPSHPQQPRPYESPFLSHHAYRPPLPQHLPPASQHHPNPPQHHPVTSTQQQQQQQQQPLTRETWMRSSQGQFAGIVEIHPPHGHIHMNGHIPPHHTSNGHIPNGTANGHAHPALNGHHPNGHHSNGHPAQVNGHGPHVNGHATHQEPGNNQNNQNNQNNRNSALVDDNQANDAHERRDDHRKDDKWGSLTRGLAAWKYHNLKEKISHKFSRGDKPEERAGAPESKHSSQGTSTQSDAINAKNNAEGGGGQQEQGAIQPGPSRDSGRLPKLNTSFRRAIHQSSQKTNLQETMETSLSAGPGGAAQPANGLPPHYPRSPGQYRAPQPLTAPPLSPPTYRAGAPHPLPSPHMGRQHQHEMLGRGLANRRSGSYHHLAQLRQEGPNWRPHHYSVDNLADAQALPSDHTYSGPAVTGGRGQPAGGENGGSGGSDSGRGTAGSGGEGRTANALDTSLDSAASQRQNAQGHSSGNDSEWVDMTDAELQRIMKKGPETSKSNGGLVRRESLAATPPLPPLSPEGSPQASPRNSPNRHRKYNLSYSVGGLNKPDLLEAAGRDGGGRAGGEGRAGNSSQGSSQSTPRRGGATQTQHSHAGNAAPSGGGSSSNHRATGGPSGGWLRRKEEERQRSINLESLAKNKNRINLGPSGELDAGEITSTTDALDLDSMLDGGEATEATSDDDATSAYDPDVHLIRKQLEGLEGMYSEVLKLLGGGRRGGRHLGGGGGGGGGGIGDLKSSRRRMHGSMSSLPSSIMSSRPGRDKRRVIDDRVRKGGRDNGKSIHKRFQRLESHVVTLARSVAHLSSEMRTQHLMFQEIESIRGEVAALRTGGVGTGGGSGGGGGGGVNTGRGAAHVSWESFRAGIPGLSNPGRVKKLTQFFGDEPPLVRIFLRKLGYEKYAGLFEQEKIGMLELPYLTEERLQKIGIPMGPRLRILQEAQGPIRKEGNLSVYVV
ncbi:uncharacterized protein LOC122266804 isoform X2 [Penaeus japonicus]|uniref:uncharacterized protein LOC122266804 isoform X2 n=1 Tax=Penaeus japonicus TaxID=27405 RepID=UPI001C71410D|nr:uncharacterized protein LOC122266804 isoform X2 [Penaeus japonicus]